MPEINVDLTYLAHRKTKRLIGLLGKASEVLPIKLWLYCGTHHAENGRLTDYSTQEIESIVDWWGKPGEFISAMLRVGYLERDGKGFRVHEWTEHQGHLKTYSLRAKVAAKARWDKAKSYATSIASSNAQDELKQCRNGTKRLKPPNPLSGEKVDLPAALERHRSAIEKWLAYKRERGQRYKPVGLSALWKKLLKIPPDKLEESIDNSMANNYAGVFEATSKVSWNGEKPSASTDASLMREKWRKARKSECHGSAIEQIDGVYRCDSCSVEQKWAKDLMPSTTSN